MSFIVAPMTQERIYGGTSEIMKTIIARDLTGLRA
jgi:alkylation response protein AidB-like acyl-CoA dehydrogenase